MFIKAEGTRKFQLAPQFVDDSGIKRQILLLRGTRIVKSRMETSLVHVGPFSRAFESYSSNSSFAQR